MENVNLCCIQFLNLQKIRYLESEYTNGSNTDGFTHTKISILEEQTLYPCKIYFLKKI